MHPPLDEWDIGYVVSLATPDETGDLEKKRSEKFTPSSMEKETVEELAKQVCAFSNSGPGFLVYGIDAKTSTLDAGVSLTVGGREEVKAWVEKKIPRIVHPPVNGCQARFIHSPVHHATGHGVLVVFIPLSDHRPHWCAFENKEVPYIRAGEHSSPMRLQTFLDISSHAERSCGEVQSLGIYENPTQDSLGGFVYIINPLIRLTGGPACTLWALEMSVPKGLGSFGAPPATSDATTRYGRNYESIRFIGDQPLFPRHPTRASTKGVRFHATAEGVSQQMEVTTVLSVGSSLPVTRKFRWQEIASWTP